MHNVPHTIGICHTSITITTEMAHVAVNMLFTSQQSLINYDIYKCSTNSLLQLQVTYFTHLQAMIHMTELTTDTLKHFCFLTLCNMLHELQRYDKAMT
jgi:hypothetical protein